MGNFASKFKRHSDSDSLLMGRSEAHWRAVSLLVVVLFLPSFQLASAQSPSLESAQTSIRGVVINSVTGEPVGRALVYSPDNRFATMTDDEGRFEFKIANDEGSDAVQGNSGEGKIYDGHRAGMPGLLMARKPGYLGMGRQSIPQNQALVVPGKDVTIELVPEGHIVGRVSLPGSVGIDRVTVELYRRQVIQGRARWGPWGGARVRSNGEFRFADLEPGAYRLFTKEIDDQDPLTAQPGGPIYGYPPMYFPNAADFQSAGTIQVTPGSTFQADLEPVRRRYFPVRVPVTNPPAGAMSGRLRIGVESQGKGGPGFELGYNDRDQRIEGALPEGTYRIKAIGMGESGATGEVSITVKGGPVEAPGLVMTPPGSVQFNAKVELLAESKTSEPRLGSLQSAYRFAAKGENFSVNLELADEFATNDLFPHPVSQHDDTVTFERVAPGNYWVHIQSERGYVASATLGDVDLLKHSLKVGAGASLTIDITLRDDGSGISGTVEDAEGRPLVVENASFAKAPHIYCIPLPDSSGQFRQAMVGPDGKFTVQPLAPGDYRVLAFDRPRLELEYENSEAMKAYQSQGQVVRLAPGEKQTIMLRVISGE